MEHTHEPRPLPDPASFPRGLVRIIIWKPTEGVDKQWSGHGYLNQGDKWHSPLGHPREFLVGEEVDWSFDGYHFDYFNRFWLLDPKHNPGPLVRLAMWALDRWALDVGLKEQPDLSKARHFFKKHNERGRFLDVDL